MNSDFDTPIAQLKFLMDGDAYRVKIFKRFLTLERQPGGDNMRLPFDGSIFAAHIYDPENKTWDIDKIGRMIDYEYQTET